MYPCDCDEMVWMMGNYDLFGEQGGSWVVVWTELDKTDSGTNIERFGVRFSHCLFCGKALKVLKG